MFRRQTTGSVLCPSCSQLVGVADPTCFHCGRNNPGLWGYAGAFRNFGRDFGFVSLITFVCGVLYVVSLLSDYQGVGSGGLFSMLSPSGRSLLVLGAAGALPVFDYGRWWTPLSAGWLHGSLLHIAFNLMWIRNLGEPIVQLYGPGRTLIIYVGSSVVGFGMTSLIGHLLPGLPMVLAGARFMTIGASASVFGLMGALYVYGQRAGSSHVTQQAKYYAIFAGFFGIIFPAIDNWAHAGGFLGGYWLARRLDPLQPERLDHLLLGVGGLVASALAIGASILTAFGYL